MFAFELEERKGNENAATVGTLDWWNAVVDIAAGWVITAVDTPTARGVSSLMGEMDME